MTTSTEKAAPVLPIAAFALVLASVAIVTGVAGLIVGMRADTAGGGGEAGVPVAAGTETVASVVEVEIAEFAITGDLIAPAGEVTLRVTNTGSIAHNVVAANGARTSDVAPGASEDLVVGSLAPGTYTIICDIPGHEAAGMTANLLVTEAGATGDTVADHDGHGGEDTDWAALDAAMLESILAFPAETEGTGNVPLEPTVLADGSKEFELTASIVDWEVEPGKIVQAWAYNAMVPGPALRVDVGDHVRVVVRNDLPMGTDVHMHGLSLPFEMDGVAPITQELIESGGEFVYEFEAEKPAIGMYHAHHHGQMQVPNGMFGTFIIGDTPIPYGRTVAGVTIPENLEIAAEIPMVLNDAGVIGFSLNGKSFPATEPLAVGEGDWFVTHYYNEGLTDHPMHLHQFPQLVFAKDGFPLEQPYYADTINIAPGERYSVLVQADRPGIWVWHCHILTHVEREEGMFGMVTALIVE